MTSHIPGCSPASLVVTTQSSLQTIFCHNVWVQIHFTLPRRSHPFPWLYILSLCEQLLNLYCNLNFFSEYIYLSIPVTMLQTSQYCLFLTDLLEIASFWFLITLNNFSNIFWTNKWMETIQNIWNSSWEFPLSYSLTFNLSLFRGSTILMLNSFHLHPSS